MKWRAVCLVSKIVTLNLDISTTWICIIIIQRNGVNNIIKWTTTAYYKPNQDKLVLSPTPVKRIKIAPLAIASQMLYVWAMLCTTH